MAASRVTPHRVALCALLGAYATPAAWPHFNTLRRGVRQKLALFLLGESQASDTYLEPSLEELRNSLRVSLGETGDQLARQLSNRMRAFLCVDDVISFFLSLKDLLSTPPYTTPTDGGGEEEDLLVEPNSSLGLFLRRCILNFNSLTFEGTCRLLADIRAYYQVSISKELVASPSQPPHNMWELDEFGTDEVLEDETALSDRMTDLVERRTSHGGSTCSDDLDFGVDTPMSVSTRRRSTRRSSFMQMHENMDEEDLHGGREPLWKRPGKDPDELLGMANLQAEEAMDVEEGDEEIEENEEIEDGGFYFAFGSPSAQARGGEQPKFIRPKPQLEAYLHQQAAVIEKQVGTMGMAELDAQLKDLLKLAPELPKVHYLRYLNFVQHGDFAAALESLHRYFDHSAEQAGFSTQDSTVGPHQAALLGLGSLHVHFGHVAEALRALNEAVQLAHQNNDHVGLAHIMASLCHLLSEAASSAHLGFGKDMARSGIGCDSDALAVQQQLLGLLQRCLRRAVELKLPHLVAFARLGLARYDLQHVRRLLPLGEVRSSGELGTSPLEVCQMLRMGCHLLSDAMSSSVTAMLPAGMNSMSAASMRASSAVSMSQGGGNIVSISGSISSQAGGWSSLAARHSPIPEAVVRLAGSAHLLRATAWELYGSAPMERISALVHATCYRDVATAEEMCTAYVKLATHLALHKGHGAALAALQMASKKIGQKGSRELRMAHLQLIHSHSLYRGELKRSETACMELQAMASPVEGVDVELKVEAQMRWARTLLAAERVTEAAEEAKHLFALCYKSGLQLERVRVLLLFADIHKKAGSPITGLSYALSSLTLAKSLSLETLRATAIVLLAELWAAMGLSHAQRALELLQECLPQVLGHGGLELQSRCHLALATCLVNSMDLKQLQADPDTVLSPLEAAAQGFEALEAKDLASEAYYMQALIYNALNREEEREEASEAFIQSSTSFQEAQNSVAADIPSLVKT